MADFRREKWFSISGEWEFEFDDENVGLDEFWYSGRRFFGKINVPYVYQCKASGINDQSFHKVMWYRKDVVLPEDYTERVFLCFMAVDFYKRVWVNGQYVGEHKGGYTPFSFDITPCLYSPEVSIIVRVEDDIDPSQPRGKQFWGEKGDRCWYTPSSGIWQDVYIEERPSLYIERVYCTSNIDDSTLKVSIKLSEKPRKAIGCSLKVLLEEKRVSEIQFVVSEKEDYVIIHIPEEDNVDETHFWSPDNPVLYNLIAEIGDDRVTTFFGMRKIEARDGRILLNNRAFEGRLILDQGYWEDTLLTPPSIEALALDIHLIKKMGFNGVRMHQKIENPWFYHLCDKFGLVVWGELPSGYKFSDEECSNLYSDMNDFIERDYNHPSIITWVPLNESWGVRNIYGNKEQQNFALSMYHFVKAKDMTRLCDTNDGWEQVASDICGVHDYVKDGEGFKRNWQDIEKTLSSSVQSRSIYADGYSRKKEPVLITEFGGIAFSSDLSGDNWGYEGGEKDEESFLIRLGGLVEAITNNPRFSGFCYTQLTDVAQEVNGLLRIDRTPKCDIEIIRKIFGLN